MTEIVRPAFGMQPGKELYGVFKGIVQADGSLWFDAFNKSIPPDSVEYAPPEADPDPIGSSKVLTIDRLESLWRISMGSSADRMPESFARAIEVELLRIL